VCTRREREFEVMYAGSNPLEAGFGFGSTLGLSTAALARRIERFGVAVTSALVSFGVLRESVCAIDLRGPISPTSVDG
jgi:hypothetical protein